MRTWSGIKPRQVHDLNRQGLSVSAIARQVGCDRKTVRKYLELGLEAPVYGPRASRGSKLDGYHDYLRGRVAEFPDHSAQRLLREIREMGYQGGYTTVKKYLRQIRPPARTQFERRFETPAGKQAQVDFAEFVINFTDEPGVTRKVWLFSLVLGHSRWLWGRFVSSQNLQSVMRCHIAAFDAMGGAPEEILYDRMKTAVIGEDEAGIVTYNTSLVALLNHYGTAPKACRPYRAKTKGKAERFIQTMLREWAYAIPFKSSLTREADLPRWLDWYNAKRPHMGIKGNTPLQALNGTT